MAYIGKNPKLKSIISEGATFSTLDGEDRQAGRLVYATDTKKFYYDDGSALLEVGSGEGGINFIGNGSAESGTDGWSTYDDASGATPSTGSGILVGSDVELVRASSIPTTALLGADSFVLKKAPVDAQGKGYAYTFSIDEGFKNKLLEIKGIKNFSQMAADGDVGVWIYDIDNGALLEPVNFEQTADTRDMCATFQSTSSDSYRLIFHVTTTDNTPWTTTTLDNVSVSPLESCGGASRDISFEAYMSAFQNFTTSGAVKINFDSITYDTAGGYDTTNKRYVVPESGKYEFMAQTLPDDITAGAGNVVINLFVNGALARREFSSILSGSTIKYQAKVEAQLDLNKGDYVEVFLASGSDTNYNIINVQPYDTVFTGRKVEGSTATGGGSHGLAACTATLSADDTGVSGTKVIPFDVAAIDTTSSLNTSTGLWTAPRSGKYLVVAHTRLQNLDSAANYAQLIQVDGSNLESVPFSRFEVSTSIAISNASRLLDLNKGQTVGVLASGDASFDIDTQSYMSIVEQNAGGGSCGKDAPIVAIYKDATGQAVGTSATQMSYPDKIEDTHNAWGGSGFTAPESGFYDVDASIAVNGQSWLAGTLFIMSIDVGGAGTRKSSFYQMEVANSNSQFIETGTTIYLNKGQVIIIYLSSPIATTTSTATAGTYNIVSIRKR